MQKQSRGRSDATFLVSDLALDCWSKYLSGNARHAGTKKLWILGYHLTGLMQEPETYIADRFSSDIANISPDQCDFIPLPSTTGRFDQKFINSDVT